MAPLGAHELVGKHDEREVSDALLRPFETWAEESDKKHSWATPVSMRTVDAESEFRITHFYQSLENLEVQDGEV